MVVILARAAHGVYVGVNEYAVRPQKRRHGRWIRGEAGSLALVLHAHLPFVRHVEQSWCAEETWFFQALAECYVPLISSLERLASDEIPYRITLSVSPTLLLMLGDPGLRKRFRCYLRERRTVLRRFVRDDRLHGLGDYYAACFDRTDELWSTLGEDVIGALGRLASAGHVELMTTAATHAYLPIYQALPEWIALQVDLGQSRAEACFGSRPRGFWLPECGYTDCLASTLSNVDYVVLDAHAADTQRVWLPGQKTMGLCRDAECSRDVWCAETGLPSHGAYREYHCDLSFEVDGTCIEQLGMFSEPYRQQTGIKCYRVTDRDRGQKMPYVPGQAEHHVHVDAEWFVNRRMAHGKPQIAAYDAELFGHWWYEGVAWIDTVLRIAHQRGLPTVSLGALAEHAGDTRSTDSLAPRTSSWGKGGDHRFWLDATNDWIVPEVHGVAVACCRSFDSSRADVWERMVCEVMAAQASDWAFMLKRDVFAEYARERVLTYLSRARAAASVGFSGEAASAGWPGDLPRLFHGELFRGELFHSELFHSGI